MRTVLLWAFLLFATCGLSQDYYLFVGTYTHGKSKGIYLYNFNASNGQFKEVSETAADNPSYLEISADSRFMYCVNEGGADHAGKVSAYSFDKVNGSLTLLNQQSSGGADPCYLSLTKSGRWAFVANYSGGSLAALPIREDGSLDSVRQLIQHVGSGTNPVRQEKAHVHSAVLSGDERFVFAADLGLDQETVYRLDTTQHFPLSAAPDSVVSIFAGNGPRHFTFHPIKPFGYLINELSGTVDVFSYQDGRLTRIQSVSSHPEKFSGEKGSADIHITPDGHYLYASNRGDANSLAIYRIDQETGLLQTLGFQSTLGKHPRNFCIDPTGHFLLVANRDSDNIVIFAIDPATGLLRATGAQIEVPNPVCLKMVKRCTTCHPKAKKKKKKKHSKKKS